MKFGMVNKSTTVNRFVLHTLHRNITHLAIITRKTNIKLSILKGGNWKRAEKSIFGTLYDFQEKFQILEKKISFYFITFNFFMLLLLYKP